MTGIDDFVAWYTGLPPIVQIAAPVGGVALVAFVALHGKKSGTTGSILQGVSAGGVGSGGAGGGGGGVTPPPVTMPPDNPPPTIIPPNIPGPTIPMAYTGNGNEQVPVTDFANVAPGPNYGFLVTPDYWANKVGWGTGGTISGTPAYVDFLASESMSAAQKAYLGVYAANELAVNKAIGSGDQAAIASAAAQWQQTITQANQLTLINGNVVPVRHVPSSASYDPASGRFYQGRAPSTQPIAGG